MKTWVIASSIASFVTIVVSVLISLVIGGNNTNMGTIICILIIAGLMAISWWVTYSTCRGSDLGYQTCIRKKIKNGFYIHKTTDPQMNRIWKIQGYRKRKVLDEIQRKDRILAGEVGPQDPEDVDAIPDGKDIK